ncbi:TetR family transcriptional regulator [Micromonospora sp. NPDC007271]|uniref:TetR/AcrR family transcriptional regulator n=1 Tax=Micromonospora sp. NPDC007271 TaxID=3154587 RepID=UPI0033C97715
MKVAGERPDGLAHAQPAAPTRQLILDIARREISECGIAGVSIRSIARQAGVDPRLVRHYYGSKEQLLRQAVQVEDDPVELAEQLGRGSRRRIGRAVATALLAHWDNPRTATPYRARLSASLASEEVAALMRDEFVRAFFGTLAKGVSPDRPELRAALAASQVVGLALCRYLVDGTELSSRSRDELARVMGRTIQHYLTADLA